jgi:hypothetical protein
MDDNNERLPPLFPRFTIGEHHRREREFREREARQAKTHFDPPPPPPPEFMPRRLSYDFSRVTTFMLSSIQGRKELDKVSDPPGGRSETFCTACDHDALWECTTCKAPLCDVCVRTLSTHKEHAIQRLPGSHHRRVHDDKPKACSTCGISPLPLPYYQCVKCRDFFLCTTCDEINDRLAPLYDELMVHNVDHPMIKYRN